MNIKRSLKVIFLGILLVADLASLAVRAIGERMPFSESSPNQRCAAVPGATVTITNLGNKTSQTLRLMAKVGYEAPFLNPAAYMVLVKPPVLRPLWLTKSS